MLKSWFRRLWGKQSGEGGEEAAIGGSAGNRQDDDPTGERASEGRQADASPGRHSETLPPDDDGFDPEQPVAYPIEDSIDLHTFSPKETASAVAEYLVEAQARGFREVRIIHGKGKGVQRRIIQGVLARHPAVASFTDAPPDRGGWGATLALLKPASSG